MRVQGRPFSVVASVVGGLLTVQIAPASYNRWLRQVRINGPSGSTFKLCLGSLAQTPFDQTDQGASNFEDYANPVPIPPGYAVFGQWSTGSGSASATFTMDRDV